MIFKTVSRQKRLDSATDQERIIYDTSVLLWNKLMRERSNARQREARNTSQSNRRDAKTFTDNANDRPITENREMMGAAPLPQFDTSVLDMPLKTNSPLRCDGLVDFQQKELYRTIYSPLKRARKMRSFQPC